MYGLGVNEKKVFEDVALSAKRFERRGRGMSWFLFLQRTVLERVRRLSRRGAAPEASLRIEERLSLGPKKMLFLVHCKGREFLVAAGAETLSPLIEVSDRQPRRKREKGVHQENLS